MLAIDAARPKLHVILGRGGWRRWSLVAIRLQIALRKVAHRAGIVGEIHVYAAAIEVGDVGGHHFTQLPVDADGGLHVVGGVEMWIDRVTGRRCATAIRPLTAWITAWIEGRILHGKPLFIGRLKQARRKVVVNRLDDIGRSLRGAEGVGNREALIEPSVARA